MILPVPILGVVKSMRFLLIELPHERERNRLARLDERIAFVERHGLAGANRDAVVALLAEGKSIQRALRAGDATASQ